MVARQKALVLDEDEWASQLDAIIERDFFPDVPKLQSKLEWLQVGLCWGGRTCNVGMMTPRTLHYSPFHAPFTAHTHPLRNSPVVSHTRRWNQ